MATSIIQNNIANLLRSDNESGMEGEADMGVFESDRSMGTGYDTISSDADSNDNGAAFFRRQRASSIRRMAEEVGAVSESTMSLQEMFNSDEIEVADVLKAAEEHAADEEPADEEKYDWFEPPDMEISELEESAPPESLQPETSSPPLPTKDESSQASSSLLDSGISPKVQTIASSAETSAASTAATGSAPRSALDGPKLYSAIGSLEKIGASSYGSWNKRHMKVGRDFNHMGAPRVAPVKQERESFMHALVSAALPPTREETPPKEGRPSRDENKEKMDKDSPATVPGEVEHVANKITGLLRNKEDKQPTGPPKKVRLNEVDVKKKKKKKRQVEMFRPSCDAYTPRMERKKIEYKPAEMRTPVQHMSTPMGTLSRPNFRDALRRVAMILRQHIVKLEHRFSGARMDDDKGLFRSSMRDTFCEENFATPLYKCTIVRIPMARPGVVHSLKKIRSKYTIPSEEEIYEFAHQLFKAVQLSSECSIVCLIYVERLMEIAKVPLLATTWRPIFMCGLLLASKVWQDLSSWNIEFASVYPQYSLEAINKLELEFLRNVKWDLYISSSLYAKYYFALRSLVEKRDFRQRYNRMVGGVDSVDASQALKIQKRTEQVKEEALLQLSRSM